MSGTHRSMKHTLILQNCDRVDDNVKKAVEQLPNLDVSFLDA